MKIQSKVLVAALFSSMLCLSAVISSCSTDEPEETNITYAENIESIFSSNCAGCHESGNNYAPVFSGYAEVKDRTENGALLDRIQSDTNPMPPAGKMSAENIQAFIDWANDGYLE
ncbi:MAG: c-type cytochrome [Bacteroidia bacterium]